ncbi:MAG: hypothetical protein JNM62_04595 [Flavobacteriales bacterium]|nr:hypothetical protein [Flavobacteriales bacterium]
MEYARPTSRVALFGLLFLSTLFGCKKEDDPASWDVDVLAPLLTTRFTLADIVPDSVQSIGPDGEITLVYSEQLFAVDLDTVLEIPDTNFRYPYAFPLPGNDAFTLPAGFPVISQNNLIRFNLPDLELSRLVVKEGLLELRMRNKIASRVLGRFTLPSATFPDGNNELSTSVEAGTPANPSFSSVVRDLAGADFDLRGQAFNDVNTLTTAVAAQLDPAGSGASVTNQDSVIVEATYRDLVPYYAKGYFGSRTIAFGSGTNRFGLFDNFVGGTLDLDRVTLRVNVENGVGMDVRVRLNELRALNTRTGVSVDLQHSILQGPINLNRAIDLGNGSQASHYTNELDNDDSNVDAFLENLPNELRYDLELELNPLGNISNGNDFVYHDSRLKADLELEVPLNVIATDLVLENILKPDLPGNGSDQVLGASTINLFATNGFPFEARVELDIVDRERELLSHVPTTGLITSGVLGSNRLVQSSVRSRIVAELTEDQMDLLYGEGRFRIRIVFNTTDQTQHLRLLDRYALDMQFTVGARYFVNGDE